MPRSLYGSTPSFMIIVRCASRRDAVPQAGHTQPIEDRLAVAVLRTFGRFETNPSINADIFAPFSHSSFRASSSFAARSKKPKAARPVRCRDRDNFLALPRMKPFL